MSGTSAKVCSTCRWWQHGAHDGDWGKCAYIRQGGLETRKAEIDGGGQGQDQEVYVLTQADFGCNQWQPEAEQ